MSAATERFAPSQGYNYHGHALSAYRTKGSNTGVLVTHGRTNKDLRQEVAGRLAAITETVSVGPRDRAGRYLLTFTTTHRILPIEKENNA